MVILLLLKFILAFCSIVYELILAQALSAFLDNTVLRYSVTIGLYMFSMGIGAMAAEGRFIKQPVLTLLRIEFLLTVIGGFAIVMLHSIDFFGFPRIIFSILVHTLIILIGILTGFELPLLMELANELKIRSENIVLAMDYAGALAGTIVFAFIFYPGAGLVATAFITGLLNAAAGLLLITQKSKVRPEYHRTFYFTLSLQTVLFFLMSGCLMNIQRITDYLTGLYLR